MEIFPRFVLKGKNFFLVILLMEINQIFLNEQVAVRYLNLLEYQSKNLLRRSNVAIQDFCLVDEKGEHGLDKFSKYYTIKFSIRNMYEINTFFNEHLQTNFLSNY